METTTTSRPGGLGIRTARTWATWQLVTVGTVTWVLGMMVGYSGQKPAAGAGTARPIVALGGLTSPSNAPTTATTAAAEPTTAPAEPASSATTAPAPADSRPAILMANTPGQGPSELPAFTAAGPWSVGWHFRCVGTPSGTGTFTLQVVPDGGAPRPAVEQTSREAQGVTPEAAPGRAHLKVTTDPACQWAVKVTGIAP